MNKILYFQHSGAKAGAPISLLLLIKFLNRDLFDPYLACISDGPMIETYKETLPDRFILAKGIYPFHGSTVMEMTPKLFIRNFLRLPQSIVSSYLFLRKHKPDIIHLNSSCLFSIAIASKYLRKDTKVICHLREPLRKNSLSGKIIRFFCNKFVDSFVAIDSYSAETMMTKKEIEVIPNVVDFSSFKPGLKNDLFKTKFFSIPESNFVLLFLARIAESNGVLPLLEDFQFIQSRFPVFSLVLAGFKPNSNGDTYENRVIQAVKKQDNVYTLEFSLDTPNIIAGCNIMIVPFTEPHFARCIIEACAMGIPSIGKDIEGVNDLIIHGETGFVYNTAEELLYYLKLLYQDLDLYNKMSKNCIELANSKFNPITNTNRIMKFYS